MAEINLAELHKGLDVTERLKARAHVNRGFARNAGTEDCPRSADFYQGRAEAFDEAADLIGT